MEERVFKDTTATKKVFRLNKRIRAVAGGTSASKTISILVWIIDYAQTVKGEIVTIVAESFPHLDLGAMRDFKAIMKANGYWDEDCWNETKHVYLFSTGTTVEFISFDKFGKAHGPRRDVLYINEANNIPYNIADQLITRTRKIVWLDWNPSEEFWFYTDILSNRDDVDFITLTYLDNEALDDISRAEIEAHRNNKQWWNTYGLPKHGEIGVLTSRIYTGWNIIDEVPYEARLERRWLDFGYTNDPSAIGDLYYLNGGYVLDEQLYQKGMGNKPLADFLLNLPSPQTLVIGDSAEPKSIDEIRGYGVNILPCEKGKDSVKNGIQLVQGQRISVTRRSYNILKEQRSYLFLVDTKTGKILNEEDPKCANHHMSGIRYAISSIIKEPPIKHELQEQFIRTEYRQKLNSTR